MFKNFEEIISNGSAHFDRKWEGENRDAMRERGEVGREREQERGKSDTGRERQRQRERERERELERERDALREIERNK